MCVGQQSGSSEGPDPSSSDLSADTVIYMGPSDDATDGEHPPVYLPSMSSGDNRCIMNKALKGSAAEKPSKLPQRKTTQKRNSLSTFHSPHPVQSRAYINFQFFLFILFLNSSKPRTRSTN